MLLHFVVCGCRVSPDGLNTKTYCPKGNDWFLSSSHGVLVCVSSPGQNYSGVHCMLWLSGEQQLSPGSSAQSGVFWANSHGMDGGLEALSLACSACAWL